MKLETLLPLGKVDLGLRTLDMPLDINKVAERIASFFASRAK